MWDTIWISSLRSWKIYHLLSQLLQSWDRSSTPTRADCQPVWSAQAGTHTRVTKSTVLIRLDSIRRETGPCQDREVPSSGVTSMPTTETIWPLSSARNSSTLPSHWLAIVMAALVELLEWSISLKMELNASSSHTKTLRSNEERATKLNEIENIAATDTNLPLKALFKANAMLYYQWFLYLLHLRK